MSLVKVVIIFIKISCMIKKDIEGVGFAIFKYL